MNGAPKVRFARPGRGTAPPKNDRGPAGATAAANSTSCVATQTARPEPRGGRRISVKRLSVTAPFIFIAILPVLVIIVLAQLSEGGMDSKALAMLGVLSALNAAMRPLGAGVNGIETVFFLLVLAGRAFGPGFGFVLGCTSLFASAPLTAGVGPWLPFQMLTSAWIGMLAGSCRGGSRAGPRSWCWWRTGCSPPTRSGS